MEISTLQIIAIFIFSCIAGMGSVLDEFQTHRPLIACTVIGLILGDLKTGIMLGGTLELIALGWMNVGAAQSPDSALASIISAILVIVGQQSIATGIAIALPVAAAGQVLTVFARTITVVFQHAADKAAEEARFRTIDLLHVSALGVQALRVAIPALIISLFVSADMVSNMLNAIPEFVTCGLQIAGGFIVVVGYAMVLRMMGVKYLMPFFFNASWYILDRFSIVHSYRNNFTVVKLINSNFCLYKCKWANFISYINCIINLNSFNFHSQPHSWPL